MLIPLNNNKIILVTGGLGFIGSNLIIHLLEKYKDYLIVNVDSITYAADLNNLNDVENHPNYHFVKCDIRDKSKLEEIFKEFNPHGIFHLAAESHVDNSIENPTIFAETNVIGTLNLLNLALKYKTKRFLHISTDEVYGSLDMDSPSSHENSLYLPRSPYSASKASSDHFVLSYFHTFGLDVVMTNCSNNFGPRQHEEKLIPTVIKNLYNRTEIPVYGDGKNIRDWLYVDDHCRALDSVFHNGTSGQKYNIGGDMELSNIDLITFMCKNFDELTGNVDSQNLISFVKDRAGHDFRYSINHDKITTDLGWWPVYSFEDSINETIKYYIKKYEL